MLAEIDIVGAFGRWMFGTIVVTVILISIAALKDPQFRAKLVSLLKSKKKNPKNKG